MPFCQPCFCYLCLQLTAGGTKLSATSQPECLNISFLPKQDLEKIHLLCMNVNYISVYSCESSEAVLKDIMICVCE